MGLEVGYKFEVEYPSLKAHGKNGGIVERRCWYSGHLQAVNGYKLQQEQCCGYWIARDPRNIMRTRDSHWVAMFSVKSFRYLRSKLYLVDRLQEKAWRSGESHVAVIGHQIWAKKKDFIH